MTDHETELGNRIARLISATEPVNIAHYMHLCMSERRSGYYAKQNPIGREGDFITAPEISQMFGELIGVWAIQAFEALGSPETFNLVELGPGRGQLMADLLRAARVKSDCIASCEVHLVETSPALREIQKQALASFPGTLKWHEDIATLPTRPSIIIGNEFLDVLPFRQYVKHDGRWLERLVAADETLNLSFALGPGSIGNQQLPNGHEREENGAVFETAPAREAIVENLAQFIAENSGAALLIDYGHASSGFGDTFQAVRNHEYVDVLASPGDCDLTSHVDFEALGKTLKHSGIVEQLNLFKVMTQSDFLLGLGHLERAGALGHGKSEATQQSLTRQVERLASTGEMGELFKCFCFTSAKTTLAPFSI